MKAMILAAGSGTRLYPLTFSLPKPMAPVLNKPVMEYIIRHIKSHNFNEVVINLHKLSHHIENYFSDGFNLGVNITYSHEEEPLGTAGGVKNVSHLFDDTFMVIGGDDLSDIDLTKLIRFHKEKKSLATIGLTYEEDVEHYGVVVTDEEGRIIEFQEKPKKEEAKSHWANNGIYIFEPEILSYIPEDSFYDFGSQLFPLLNKKGVPFYGYKCKGYWKDIGNLVAYRNAHFDCLMGNVKIKLPGNEIKPGIWVQNSAQILEKVKIIPPVFLGESCTFGENVILEGPLVIGNNNTFSDNVHIKKSILWNDNIFNKNVYLNDCLVGNNCRVEEGLKYDKTVLGCGLKHILKDYFNNKMNDVVPS